MTSKLTRERLQEIAEDGFLKHGESKELARMALTEKASEPVILCRERNPYNGLTTGWQELTENEFSFLKENAGENAEFLTLYRHAQPAPDRDNIRREHAEWSQSTFGNVGPIGPLKHLSKEALEAAAEPGDLSEWADMQFLLWDAQRRAGITDEQITQAMIEKLAVNKQREWPEPKDGEPRLHIKAQPAPEYPETLPCPVLLEPGLRFGKGIKTSTMLAALSRRAVYESDMAALSPEERVEFQTGIEDVKALIAQSTPVVPDGYVTVPREPTDEMIAAAMNCEDVLFNSDDSFCVQFGNIYEAMLAAAPHDAINALIPLVSRNEQEVK